jgi:hypothetical protein
MPAVLSGTLLAALIGSWILFYAVGSTLETMSAPDAVSGRTGR